jgi:hypothetical protein
MTTNMKKSFFLCLGAMLMLAIGMSSCSKDDENIVDPVVDPVVDEVNVLLIQSDNGKTSTGTVYKSGETYNPPHCYLGKEIRYNRGNELTFYHMSFAANIKGSDVFDNLGISFESNQPMSFNNLKAGDTFDSSQFQADASYTPTWTEKVMICTTAFSGNVTVLGTSKVGDKSYMTLKLTDLRFDAIDHSCVYSVSGIVEYEMWE